MKAIPASAALKTAVLAARQAGGVMRKNQNLTTKAVNQASQHDIKLELDVKCQQLIEKTLKRSFPQASILGEEGVSGDPASEYRWVVDPIDGTVNFTYGIPHACVSIALDRRVEGGEFQTVVGVVYDPFCDELWTAIRGKPARLNGRVIRVSQREKLEESIISLGFAKHRSTLNRMLPVFNTLVPKVRKIRIMGAAALAMVYVASGRLEAYLEYGVRWWDVAAGGLILECAGGSFLHEWVPKADPHTCRILASNGRVEARMKRYF